MPAQYLGSVQGDSHSVTREYAVASGVTVTDGDLVYLDTNGRVSNASIAGKRLLGQVTGSDTNNLASRTNSLTAVGNAGGTVKVLVNVEDQARYLIKCNNATNTLREASQGRYYGVTGATGAQVVDGATESATAGQLVCIKFNPGIRGTDSTYGIFAIAQEQLELG